jgi:flagellar biosynthetic protein FliP
MRLAPARRRGAVRSAAGRSGALRQRRRAACAGPPVAAAALAAGSDGSAWRPLVWLTLGLALLMLCAAPALAQQVTLDFGEGPTVSARVVQLFLLVTVLSLVPGLAVMVTCFPFIVTVLSILRQAIGLQQAPPNMLIISLSLFLTWFVMDPVLAQAWTAGIEPLTRDAIPVEQAVTATLTPFRVFMADRLDPETYAAMAALRPDAPPLSPDASLSLLVPSFLLSEVQRAFEIGFLIFLPFLIIDLVVAAVLMSMGMMMVPPAVVALPFKLAFFVVADGWALISGALVRSYF